MLKSISWHELLHAVLLIFCAYYLVFLLITYKKELLALRRDRRVSKSRVREMDRSLRTEGSNIDIQNLLVCGVAATEIRTLICQIVKNGFNKQDLLRGLADILEKINCIQNSTYGNALITFIILDCLDHNIKMDASELIPCWESPNEIIPPSL